MDRRWSRTFGLVAGAAVLVVAAGAGGAVAGHKVTSAQIKNHTIRGKDVHAKTLGYSSLTRSTRSKLDGAIGWVTVDEDGSVLGHGGSLAAPHVTNQTQGSYCISGPGWGNGAYSATPIPSPATSLPILVVDPTPASSVCDGVYVGTDNAAGGGDDSGFMLAKLG